MRNGQGCVWGGVECVGCEVIEGGGGEGGVGFDEGLVISSVFCVNYVI